MGWAGPSSAQGASCALYIELLVASAHGHDYRGFDKCSSSVVLYLPYAVALHSGWPGLLWGVALPSEAEDAHGRVSLAVLVQSVWRLGPGARPAGAH